MNNYKNEDLTKFSSTFPNMDINPIIVLDSKIREINKKFDQDYERIIIEGPQGSGKSVLLSQFVLENKECCFSYFLSDDYWVLRQSAFLSSLCNQMIRFLQFEDSPQNDLVDLYRYDIEHQKYLFSNLTQKIVEKVKTEKITSYFVIDGIEKAFEGKSGERIIDLFPLPVNSKGLFLLGSSEVSLIDQVKFEYCSLEPHYFSLVETEKYLEDLSFSEEKIKRIQSLSGGVPGILSVTKTLVKTKNINVDQILNEPLQLGSLLEYQLKNILKQAGDEYKRILSLLAFSLVPLDLVTISNITNIEIKTVERIIQNSSILRKNNKVFGFFPDLHKQIAQKYFSDLKDSVILNLIEFYSTHKELKEAGFLLPEYLKISNNFQGLENLYTAEYLSNISIENNSLSLSQKNLADVIDIALEEKNLAIIKFGVAISQLNSLENQMVGISEVKALISLKRFDEAIKLAYSSKLITTKIRLLSQIYLKMEKEGETISRDSIYELENLVKNLEISEMKPEVLLDTATDIFILLPDLATELLDKANILENKSPIELVAMMASVKSEDSDSDAFLDKISNEDMHDFALVNSRALSKLPASQIIRKSTEARNTKSKEYLLRHWCIQNKTDPDVHIVIDKALDLLLSDSNYTIPLRNLRQLSEPLKFCQDKSREFLIDRFYNLLLTALDSPVQEKVRLELNFVEALYKINPARSLSIFNNIFATIIDSEFELDIDIFCYCLARFLITVSNIDPNDKLMLQKDIKDKLENAYLKILETSADQLFVTRGIIRSISQVDIQLALAFAEMLNTVLRRDNGIQEVLTSYIRQNISNISVEVISKSLNEIIDYKIRETTLLKLVSISKEQNHFQDKKFFSFILNSLDMIFDPISRTKFIAELLSEVSENDECKDILYNKLLDSWEKIDVLWLRVESGYNLISTIAGAHKNYAEDIFTQSRKLRHTSSLANQQIGVLFYESLLLATRAVGGLDLSNPDALEKWNLLFESINFIPSRLLRLHLFGCIAVSRLRSGDKKIFDEIVKEQIIPGLQTQTSSNLLNTMISELALPLFEFNPDEASFWVEKLPYHLRNITWYKVAFKIITQSNIFDPIGTETPNVCIDFDTINEVIRIINFCDRDQEIYNITQLLCHCISNANCRLPEIRKIDFLTKIEDLINRKLPDKINIFHNGYQILANGEIERAKRKSAKKTKNQLVKKYPKIAKDARQIENFADRVFVLTELSLVFQEINRDLADSLIEESYENVLKITNVRDRIDRLVFIGRAYSELRNKSKYYEVFKLAKILAGSLQGIEKDRLLSSIIQTVNQIDKNLATQINEKIDNFSTQFSLENSIKAYELAKSPNKIISQSDEIINDEILSEASKDMLKALIYGKSTYCTNDTILKWVSSTKLIKFELATDIFNWVFESLFRQALPNEKNNISTKLIESIITNCVLLDLLGINISLFSEIPESYLNNFHGISTNKKLFKVGERQKAINFIKEWLSSNCKNQIVLCDPYFSEDQLWILQSISEDISVKIITTGKQIIKNSSVSNSYHEIINNRELRKKETERIQIIFQDAWNEISNQAPPPTLIIIHGMIFDTNDYDSFHDRYLLSRESGLVLGTSLNGFGGKESFISVMNKNDVDYVYDNYISPKIKIEELFSKTLFFEL